MRISDWSSDVCSSDLRTGDTMSTPIQAQFMTELVSGKIKIIDLTETLTPEFPTIVMPPEFGQAWPFRIEEISRYDERGPAWYWNNFSCSEHTGTHFDAPIHWVSGKDQPNNRNRKSTRPNSSNYCATHLPSSAR